jgi:hypothetical protein
MRNLARRSVACGGVAMALLLQACVSDDTSTQLTVALSSEASIPTEVNELEVRVSSGGSVPLDDFYDLTRDDNGYFPQTLALIPKDQASLGNPVTVTVIASAPNMGETVVSRTVTASYVQGHTLLLPVALRMACFQTTCDSAGYSCVGGQCVPANVPSESLVDYQKQYVFGEAGSCFDMQTCLGDASPTSVGTEPLDAHGNVGDCTFPLPVAAKSSSSAPSVNVAIEWAAAPGRIIVLDANDPAEGWTVSSTDSTKGVLSQGICNAVKASPTSPGYSMLSSKAANAGVLYLSTACAPKRALSPSCDPKLGIGVSCPGGKCAL